MGGMFRGAASSNQPLGARDVSEVTDMGSMFEGAASFNQPLADWDVSKVESMFLFDECPILSVPSWKETDPEECSLKMSTCSVARLVM